MPNIISEPSFNFWVIASGGFRSRFDSPTPTRAGKHGRLRPDGWFFIGIRGFNRNQSLHPSQNSFLSSLHLEWRGLWVSVVIFSECPPLRRESVRVQEIQRELCA
eukprot:1350787-Amorphochlora_amoeboformis.AAC.1